MLCSQQVENYSIVLCLFRGLNYNISLPQKQHSMPDTRTLTSVHNIPGAHASAAFTSKTSEVFKEEHNFAPIIINDKMKYIPWEGDNQMPYNIINLIESDETMSIWLTPIRNPQKKDNDGSLFMVKYDIAGVFVLKQANTRQIVNTKLLSN